MGEAPGGGSLSTYKELCALATDMGQPDLVYRFMDLANHHASLNSSRGAAFGWGTWLVVHIVCVYCEGTAKCLCNKSSRHSRYSCPGQPCVGFSNTLA